MKIWSYVIYLCLSLLLAYVIYRFVKWQKMLSAVFKLPGPKRLPVIHNMIDFLSKDSVKIFNMLRKWNQEYGGVYVGAILGRSTINISSPEAFEVIASSMKHIEKGNIYKYLHPWMGNGLLTSTGPQWQQRRKILTPAFHFSILQEFSSVFNKEVDHLVERLKEETKKTYTNVIPMMSHSTLNIIAETSFGTKLNLDNSEDKKYVKAIYNMGDLVVYRTLRPWFEFQIVFDLFSSLSKLHRNVLKTLHDFTNRIIKERTTTFTPFEVSDEDSSRKKLAFLDLLLNAKIRNGIIDDDGIRDEVNTFMFEGHDTTAMALTFSLLLLAENEKYQDMLFEEITSVMSTSDKHPDFREINEMKLLDRVVKECLRLYPSVPLITRKLDSSTLLQGYFIPKDADITVWIYDIHRNPNHWPDPHKFDPDRFLPENCVNRHPYAYVPFSAGPRNCIGQKFAILEIKSTLCGIIKNFIVEPVDTRKSVRFALDLVLRTHDGSLKLKFKRR